MATRSVSLPSKLNPIEKRIEEKLKPLRAKERLSKSGSEAISIGLSGLADLYECINEYLTPTQQALSLKKQEGCALELLKQSSILLEMCSTIKDIVLQQKEASRRLESALLKKSEFSAREKDIARYSSSRKEIMKQAKEATKQLEGGCFGSSRDDYQELGSVRSIRCVAIINISVCESLLMFMSTKPKRSLLSKLMNKRTDDRENENGNELSRLDADLKTVFSGKRVDGSEFDIVMKDLKDLEGVMERIENGFESVCKKLTETKSSLMNITAVSL